MRYSLFSAAVLAVTSVLATDPTSGFDPISVPTNLQAVAVGDTLNIVWDATSSVSAAVTTVNIYLLEGASQSTLQVAADPIASGILNSAGTYAWTVTSAATGFALYGFQIVDASNAALFQYSFPFTITTPTSSSSSSSSTPTPTPTPTPSASGSTTIQQVGLNASYTPSGTTPCPSSAGTPSSSPTPSTTPPATSPVSGNSTGYVPHKSGSNATFTTTKSASATPTAGSSSSNGTSGTITTSGGSMLANSGFALVGALLLAVAL